MVEKMFCYNCGQKLDDTAIYCEQCGVKIRKEDSTQFFSESDALFRYHELEYELEDIKEELETLPSKQAYINRLSQSRDQKLNQLKQVRNVMLKEKKDYDDLLKLSFSSIKARLSGDLDQKKLKEEAEYLEALANFEYIEKEYQNLENDVKSVQNDIDHIQGLKSRIPTIESEMEKLLEQLTSGKATESLKKLEGEYKRLQKEVTKAQDIYNKFNEAESLMIAADNYLISSVDKLRHAESLGTWDIFFRGGIFIDSMKHGNLDGARHDINQAQALIRRARDLVDVIDDIYIDFEAPNLFFDIFFDNFFFDIFGNTKITRTRERVEGALHQLSNSRNTLNQHKLQWEQKRNNFVSRINNIRKQIREERFLLI
ncbi:MAG: hypothetical protein ACFE9V_19330 [Candidatus Hodarchaeota archaeon]